MDLYNVDKRPFGVRRYRRVNSITQKESAIDRFFRAVSKLSRPLADL